MGILSFMLHWSEISEKNIYYLHVQARCSSPYCHFLDFFALHTCPFFTPVSKTVHITFISNGRLSLCMTCFSRPSTRLTSLQMLYFIWLLLGLPAWAALQSVLLSVYWQLMSNGRIPKWPSAVLLAAAEEDMNNDVIYYWSTSSSRSSNVRASRLAVNCALIRVWHATSRHVANRRTNLGSLYWCIFSHTAAGRYTSLQLARTSGRIRYMVPWLRTISTRFGIR